MNWREKWQKRDGDGDAIKEAYELADGGWLVIYEKEEYGGIRFDKHGFSASGAHRLLPVPATQVVPFTSETAPDDILRVRWKRSGGAGCCVFAVNKSGVIRISGAAATKCITWDVLCRECEILRLSTGWVPGGEVKK